MVVLKTYSKCLSLGSVLQLVFDINLHGFSLVGKLVGFLVDPLPGRGYPLEWVVPEVLDPPDFSCVGWRRHLGCGAALIVGLCFIQLELLGILGKL